MKNQTPKVLNQVCGLSMLGHVIAASRELNAGASHRGDGAWA